MNEYIKNVKKELENALNNKDLDYIGSLLYDLTQYAIIMKSNNIILITTTMRDVIYAYSIFVEDYILPEKFQDTIIIKAINFIKEGLSYLDKSDFNPDIIISLFNWIRTIKFEKETDLKKIRNKKDFQKKKIENLIE